MRYILSNFSQFVKVLGLWIKSKIIVILLIFLAFGSGLIVGGKFLKRPSIVINGNIVDIKDLKIDSNEKVNSNKVLESTGFVASSRGKYYYPKGCSLAKNLSEANLLTFETEKEAIDAGYIKQEKCY